jgi:transposase
VTTDEEHTLEPTDNGFDWSTYNDWQAREMVRVVHRLRDLVDASCIHNWSYNTGRPRIPRRTIILGLLIRAYFDLSFRRTEGLLHLLKPHLGIEHVPHFNTLCQYNQDRGITNTLKRLLDHTAEPFWSIEEKASVDASGLVLTGQGAWHARKHDAKARKYAKTHVLNGVNTRATLAVTFTRGHRHDSQELPDLVDAVPEDAALHAVLGDKAYWTRDNCQVVKDAGLQPYFKPKTNARWWRFPSDAFEKMTRFALQFPNRFQDVYRRRCTAESRFATVKLLFGDRLRCRQGTSRGKTVVAREIGQKGRLLDWWEARSGQN